MPMYFLTNLKINEPEKFTGLFETSKQIEKQMKKSSD